VKNAESHADLKHGVREHLQGCLRRWRRRLLWQRMLHTLAAAAVLLSIGRLLETPASTLVQQMVAVAVVWFAQLRLSTKWRNLTPDNFLQHLNRHFPDFEESAQLLLRSEAELSTLQSLQRERVVAVFDQNTAQVERWQPPVKYRSTLLVILGCLAIAWLSDHTELLTNRFFPRGFQPTTLVPVENTRIGFDSITVTIVPPAYTGLPRTQTDQLDLELAQGSQVQWDLSFDDRGAHYALSLSDDQRIALKRGDNDRFIASTIIEKSDLYRITRSAGGEDETTGEIHTLTVKLDRAPDIRVIEPQTAALEIPRNGPARFSSKALVMDDYGVATVGILASVAKGSGEGVKFRDQTLGFDRFSETDSGLLYQKDWDLQSLGMEPGDEVYFTVIATDNRLPRANEGRSETLIVRWLDDQPAELAADGLGIDFIPEYFKSQRQIIIDTEQLLEDEAHLPQQAFKDTSYELGHAQADLKQKYGQFLGDEFGEGPGEQLEGSHEGDDNAQQHHEDDHGQADPQSADMSINTTADIIRFFGHDHGEPEIGPITRRNPVALMKRAINEMWQAERHLMQAEPALALPFEYEAYKYLKLARQADRIYVKRLGFEPPPVSEDRRGTGKRDEILSYSLSEPDPMLDPGGEQWNQQLLSDVYHLLRSKQPGAPLNEDERKLLSRLAAVFTTWSQQRAALIRHAANLERLSTAGRLAIENCETCLSDLETTIWNRIDNGPGQFHHGDTTWYPQDGLIQAYQQVLEQMAEPVKERGIPAEDSAGDRQ